MTSLLLGLVLFLGVHSISIVAPSGRDRLVQRLGAGPWQGLYSLVSAVGLGLIAWGYVAARAAPVLLYVPPSWTTHLTAVLLVPVFPLLLAAYLPGRIRTATKHPMLTAVKLWAAAHLVANGLLHDVLLFGSFLAWAVVDRISFRWRVQRPIPSAPPGPMNDAVAVGLGLVLYALFVAGLHRWLVGVAPLPGLSFF